MDYNFFQEKIIQNLDDMEDALSGYDLDDFYITIENDREEGYQAFFYLNVDGELIAQTEGGRGISGCARSRAPRRISRAAPSRRSRPRP